MSVNLGRVNSAAIAIWRVIARYPAVSAGLANIAVVVGTKFGLHLNANQVVEFAAAAAGVFGILVHMGVIPVAKVDNVNAGIKPTVPAEPSVLVTPPTGPVGQVK